MDKTQSDFNGGYKIKNLKFTGITCKTNMPSNTAFRSFGSPEGLLVMEDIIFKIACTLGLSQETVLYGMFNQFVHNVISNPYQLDKPF